MIAETTVSLAVVSMIGTVLTGIVATIGTYLTQKAKADQEEHKVILTDLGGRIDQVQADLQAHVTWEMNEKYKEQP